MPIYWKLLFYKFLKVFLFFNFFFISILFLFKISFLTKYAIRGYHIKELSLFMVYMIAEALPFVTTITSLIGSYLVVKDIKDYNEILAFSSFGLNPNKILSPIIFIGILICIVNLSINSIFCPLLRNSIEKVVNNQKETIDLLPTLGSKINQNSKTMISININPNQSKGSDFLFVRNDKVFSLILSDDVHEDKKNVYIKHPLNINISPEESDHDTIEISHNQLLKVDKNSIFLLFPESLLHISSKDNSMAQKINNLSVSLFPIVFILLGILLSSNKKFYLSCFLSCLSTLLFSFNLLFSLSYFSTLSFIWIGFILLYYIKFTNKYQKEMI